MPTRLMRQKRSFSNSFGGNNSNGRRPDSLHFLMGGNIRDPLNLNSVKPEDPSRGSAQGKPIEVIIPKNVNDPLNLLNMPSLEQTTSKKKKKKRKLNLDDMIVSPVVCQRRFSSRFNNKKLSKREDSSSGTKIVKDDFASPSSSSNVITKTKEKANEKQQFINQKYRYGNYNHYRKKSASGPVNVGDPSLQFDSRVRIFCENWFENKQVLDIGCGAGTFTLSIAQMFRLHRIVGIDIDPHLIGAARKNLRHFFDRHLKLTSKFPASFPLNFGPINAPSTSIASNPENCFPENVLFHTQNYVLESDEELENVKGELYDTVMAISVVKWVHLNWGDEGLKRFFRRAFLEMRTGGRFIVEIEGIEGYRKFHRKRRMTAEMNENFEQIRLFPEDFCSFLLSDEVGFKHHEALDTPLAHTFGWSGRLHVFYKGEFMISN